jgi:probable F420-dependent oxidoreductase
VALAMAAAVTERLKLGTGICLVVQRDPITTAKEVATLDHLSGGRFLFGVGAGWNREEMRNHGTDPDRRFSVMRERVEAMKAIWTQDEAEYHGEHVDFGPIWPWPKPRQRPHPPALVGGTGETALDRVLAFGDEWMPNRVDDPERLGERIAELERRAEEAGRERIPVSVFGARPDAGFVERLGAVGVGRCLFYLRPAATGEVERQLDELARLRDEVATPRTA